MPDSDITPTPIANLPLRESRLRSAVAFLARWFVAEGLDVEDVPSVATLERLIHGLQPYLVGTSSLLVRGDDVVCNGGRRGVFRGSSGEIAIVRVEGTSERHEDLEVLLADVHRVA